MTRDVDGLASLTDSHIGKEDRSYLVSEKTRIADVTSDQIHK